MLDEYKEDFGTGIDDLQFDTPQNNYPETQSSTQAMSRDQYYMPPAQELRYEMPLRQPTTIPAFQGAGPVGDPTQYEQPQYAGYNQGQSIGEILRSKEPRLGCLRTLFLGGISLTIIALSFWGSFILGQKIFMPPVKEQFLKSKQQQIPDFLNPSTRKLAPVTIPQELIAPKTTEKIFVKSTGLKPKTTATQYKPSQKYTTPARRVYRVIAGSFGNKQNARLTMQQLKDDGFDTFIKEDGGKYQVQVGAFSNKNSAQRLLERALSYGYEASIVN
ncbi:SPOR domain-containing protein [Candidatus Margulisiibacteriota bacterium]